MYVLSHASLIANVEEAVILLNFNRGRMTA
jgi:hypothetical protein